MNVCSCLRCRTCGTEIDCRFGLSNRDIQPFQFACPVCEEKISLVFGEREKELQGAEEIEFDGPFEGDRPFVDLHLDFPVYFGEYVKGYTTFFRVTKEIGLESYKHLNLRLNILNMLYPLRRDLGSLILQYKLGNIENFERICPRLPGVQLASHRKQDVLAALYSATTLMSSPFALMEQNVEISDKAPRLIEFLYCKHNAETIEFVERILGNGFLKNLHIDCLSLYPRLVAMDLPFRAAFFYDYEGSGEPGNVPARISTADFEECSNFYKDLAEVFARQITLIAGINNLLKRGHFDMFEASMKITKGKNPKPRAELENLNSFANVDLGKKISYLDDCFYSIDMEAIDNKLRNAIAHYKYEYKESTQVITYYPAKEGMAREKYYEISFMNFIRKSLLLFREVHSVNHIIKAFFYFCVFILKKEI